MRLQPYSALALELIHPLQRNRQPPQRDGMGWDGMGLNAHGRTQVLARPSKANKTCAIPFPSLQWPIRLSALHTSLRAVSIGRSVTYAKLRSARNLYSLWPRCASVSTHWCRSMHRGTAALLPTTWRHPIRGYAACTAALTAERHCTPSSSGNTNAVLRVYIASYY